MASQTAITDAIKRAEQERRRREIADAQKESERIRRANRLRDEAARKPGLIQRIIRGGSERQG